MKPPKVTLIARAMAATLPINRAFQIHHSPKAQNKLTVVIHVFRNLWLIKISTVLNLNRKATRMRPEIATKNRLCRLVANTNATAISNHLKPKVNPRYLATLHRVGLGSVKPQ